VSGGRSSRGAAESLRGYLRSCLSYSNVVATIALFIALGGASYAVLHVSSSDVADNSLRSRDIRNNTLRSRDVRDRTIRERDVQRNGLTSGAIKESALSTVPRASDAGRVGGLTADDLRLKCPGGTLAKAGVCIETSPRSPEGFASAAERCSQSGRGLPTFAQLDPFARSSGPLPQPEWTGSVYRNTDQPGSTLAEQLEAVLLGGVGDVSYGLVNSPAQHAFRCVALPSN
jgi:hypothetical protein